jgi:hypothetical protein
VTGVKMAETLKEFLIQRKLELLEREKWASGVAQDGVTFQIQVFDIILMFMASKQAEEDMEKLKQRLDDQIIKLRDIQPRQENQELTEELIRVANTLQKAWNEEVRAAQREKRAPEDLAKPMEDLPKDPVPKSVSTKIYALRQEKKLPPNCIPKIRIEKYKAKERDPKTGEEIEVTKTREHIYMAWVQNYPPLKDEQEK